MFFTVILELLLQDVRLEENKVKDKIYNMIPEITIQIGSAFKLVVIFFRIGGTQINFVTLSNITKSVIMQVERISQLQSI